MIRELRLRQSTADSEGCARYVVTDVMGRTTSEGTTNLIAGVHAFDVPVSGMIALERRSGG